jgi:hypothetical protein
MNRLLSSNPLRMLGRSFAILTFLTIIISCVGPEKDFDSSLMASKAWFDKHYQTISGDAQNDFAKIGKQFFWERAKKLEIGEVEGFSVPIWFEKKYSFGKQSIRELWITVDIDGNYDALIMEVLSTTDSYLKNNGNINLNGHFSGIITFHKLNGELVAGNYFENGIQKGSVKEYRIGSKDTKMDRSGMRASDCGYSYNYVSNGVVYVTWVSEPCFTWLQWKYNMYPSYGQQWVDSQYGCEVDSSCWPTYEVYHEPYYYVPDDYIYNNIGTPCLNSLASTLIDANLKNEIALSLSSIFGVSTSSNLTIEEDANLSVPGRTQVTSVQNPFNVTIWINSNLVNASKEYSAAVIYHESLHAFINASDGTYLSQLEQHVEIAEKYVIVLRDALIEVFPNLSIKDANGLALSGLRDVMTNNPPYFNTLITRLGFANVSELNSLNDSYKNKTKGTPSN